MEAAFTARGAFSKCHSGTSIVFNVNKEAHNQMIAHDFENVILRRKSLMKWLDCYVKRITKSRYFSMPPSKLNVGRIDRNLIIIHPHFRTEYSKISMQTLKTHLFHYYCILFVKSFALFSVIKIIVHLLA